MAEFVAVVDEAVRSYNSPNGETVCIKNATVIGLRVNDGPTIEDSNPNPIGGKVYERCWTSMPDNLAFATEAFYKVIYQQRNIPNGFYYDCHAYHRYAMGYSNSPVVPNGTPSPWVNPAEASIPPLLLLPYRGYGLLRPRTDSDSGTGTIASVHSFITLSRRFGIMPPECLGVEYIGGKMSISGTGKMLDRYGAVAFYSLRNTEPNKS